MRQFEELEDLRTEEIFSASANVERFLQTTIQTTYQTDKRDHYQVDYHITI